MERSEIQDQLFGITPDIASLYPGYAAAMSFAAQIGDPRCVHVAGRGADARQHQQRAELSDAR
jgi:hypothetical protein